MNTRVFLVSAEELEPRIETFTGRKYVELCRTNYLQIREVVGEKHLMQAT